MQQPAKRRAMQPWVVVGDEDMDPPSDEPSTPKLMIKSQTKLVRRKNPLGQMTQYVEITDQSGAKTYHELASSKQQFHVEQSHRRWRRFSMGTLWKARTNCHAGPFS